MTEEKKEGRLVIVEGLDGLGKTTVCGILEGKIIAAGRDAATLSFPSKEGAIGKLIRQRFGEDRDLFHDDAILHLFGADALDVHARAVGPLLKQGIFVICDRHPFLSAFAYQVEETHQFRDYFSIIASVFWNRIKDASIYLLEAPVAMARKRLRTRGKDLSSMDSAPASFQERVAERYRKMGRRGLEATQFGLSVPKHLVVVDVEDVTAEEAAISIFADLKGRGEL